MSHRQIIVEKKYTSEREDRKEGSGPKSQHPSKGLCNEKAVLLSIIGIESV
jgi:hypothetical protein